MTIHVHIHRDATDLADMVSAMGRLADQVAQLAREMRAEKVVVMKELDDLQAAVTKTNDAEQSAITLIKGIADQLTAAKADPAAIAALAGQLNGSADALAAAILANTPAAA